MSPYEIIELFRDELKNDIFNSSLDENAQNEVLCYIDEVANLVIESVSSKQ